MTNVTQDETMNNNHLAKSKFSSDKNNTSETFFERISIHQREDKASTYEQNWKMEMEKNRKLEGKVNELLHEMEAYEEELDSKRKEIDKLNLSLSKRNNTSFNESRARNR